jgi:hypothetical protein
MVAFLYSGTLNSYIFTFLIHQSLLVNGVHLIHVFQYRRSRFHRRIFALNTAWTTGEFLFSWVRASWFNRLGNLCPDLTQALASARTELIGWTIGALLLSIILALFDFVCRLIDGNRYAKDRQKKGPPALHPKFRWNPKLRLNIQRVVYAIVSLVIFSASIWVVESRIMQYSHEKVRAVPGLSSDENVWAPGQYIATAMAAIPTLVTVYQWLRKVTKWYARVILGSCPVVRFNHI